MPSVAQTRMRPNEVEFLLQRGLLLRTRLFNQTGDAAQLRVHRRGHDHGPAGARRDAGAHEHHVLAVAERDVALLQSCGLLRHRIRLSGERGLDAPERGRLQEPGIGRDQVAGFQREDVAGDDSGGGNRSDLPVAPHRGLGRGQLLERRDGLLGLEFLVEADDRVEDDNGEDGDAVHHFTEEAGDDTGGDENPDDEALELAEENLERADGFAFLQFVRAVDREPLRRFLRRETIRSGSQLGQHLLSRLAVPGFARRGCRRWPVQWSWRQVSRVFHACLTLPTAWSVWPSSRSLSLPVSALAASLIRPFHHVCQVALPTRWHQLRRWLPLAVWRSQKPCGARERPSSHWRWPTRVKNFRYCRPTFGQNMGSAYW